MHVADLTDDCVPLAADGTNALAQSMRSGS